jgi:membrane-bound serine protease (ClpP class)
MIFLLDPNFAFVLLAVAFLVTIFALLAPGTGVLEVVSLGLLTLVGLSIARMEIHTWAILLLLGGIVGIILALRRFDNRYFLVLAILLLLAGMLFLFKTPGQFLSVDPLLAGVVSLSTAAFIWTVGRMVAQAFKAKPQRNLAKLIGEVGRAVTDISTDGSVYVGGENWSAVSEKPIKKGSSVVVLKRDGLVLKVEEISKTSKK